MNKFPRRCIRPFQKTFSKDVIGYGIHILLTFLVKVLDRSLGDLKKIVHHKSFFKNKNKIIKI